MVRVREWLHSSTIGETWPADTHPETDLVDDVDPARGEALEHHASLVLDHDPVLAGHRCTTLAA